MNDLPRIEIENRFMKCEKMKRKNKNINKRKSVNYSLIELQPARGKPEIWTRSRNYCKTRNGKI